MKSTTIVLSLSLLASTALSQPHKQAIHRHQHKRDQTIKWVTEWAVETEVVAVTETIWVSEGFVPTTTTTSSTTSSNAPAQFFQPASSKAKSSPAPSSSSVYVAPPPVSTPEPTTTTTTSAPAPKPTEQEKAPEPVTTSTTTTTTPPPAPSPEPVKTTTTSAYVAPAAPSSSAAPVQSSAPSSGGSSGGECSKASPCTGDITHYEAGLGACGWESDGETSNVIALPHGLMGTQSNGNPYCGRKVTVTLNGKSIVAEVVDKCMGCEGHSIDLSNAAFKELEDMGVGRTQASWYFMD